MTVARGGPGLSVMPSRMRGVGLVRLAVYDPKPDMGISPQRHEEPTKIGGRSGEKVTTDEHGRRSQNAESEFDTRHSEL